MLDTFNEFSQTVDLISEMDLTTIHSRNVNNIFVQNSFQLVRQFQLSQKAPRETEGLRIQSLKAELFI